MAKICVMMPRELLDLIDAAIKKRLYADRQDAILSCVDGYMKYYVRKGAIVDEDRRRREEEAKKFYWERYHMIRVARSKGETFKEIGQRMGVSPTRAREIFIRGQRRYWTFSHNSAESLEKKASCQTIFEDAKVRL